jgi:GT2 family glycosyltransferase
MRTPRLSIVLATHDRRDVLAHTLDQLAPLTTECGDVETIVVDNASHEDVESVTRGRSGVQLLRLTRNVGSCAKGLGVRSASAPVILFLDDDSYPRAGSIEHLLARFDADPTLGAAGFTVHLPDGAQECSALPHVYVGCGVGLRTAALKAVGGLDVSFFMQAEEYDLSFRLLQAGWKVEIFDDLAVEHLKTPHARRSQRTTYFDVVNNLRVIARYLPQPYARIYRADWLARYRRLAHTQDHDAVFRRGRRVGWWRALLERPAYRRWRLSPAVLEQVFCWSYVAARMAALKSTGVRRVVLLDFGKNLYAFYRGAQAAGLEILAVGDACGGPSAPYRDTRLVSLPEALAMPADALVISNTSYVHAARRATALAGRVSVPIHNWFPPPLDTPKALSVRIENMVHCCQAPACY